MNVVRIQVRSQNINKHYFSDKILGEIAEVIRPRDVGVCEEVLVRILGIVAISQKKLEQVEEPKPI